MDGFGPKKIGEVLVEQDEIVNMLAHDLRNPLFAIKTKLPRLRKAAPSAAVIRDINAVADAVERMEKLIGSVLDSATIVAGKLALVPSNFSAESLIAECMLTLTPLYEQKGITFIHESPETLMIEADRERALQALANLLSNALKFSPPGGTVRVATERHGDFARFAIHDEGNGIAPVHLKHVFDRFWKEDVNRAPGTGLGLFIAKAILDAHRGEIWVESGHGSGTSFFFTLPIARTNHAVAGASAVRASAAQAMTTLRSNVLGGLSHS